VKPFWVTPSCSTFHELQHMFYTHKPARWQALHCQHYGACRRLASFDTHRVRLLLVRLRVLRIPNGRLLPDALRAAHPLLRVGPALHSTTEAAMISNPGKQQQAGWFDRALITLS
jgi:hypothetical protein